MGSFNLIDNYKNKHHYFMEVETEVQRTNKLLDVKEIASSK